MSFRIIAIGVTIIVMLSLLLYINSLKNDILTLENSLSKAKLDSAMYRQESVNLRVAVQKQNDLIDKLRVDRKNAIIKLNNWKKLPPKIKYKTIVKIREVKSDACDDVSNVINAVRTTPYELL